MEQIKVWDAVPGYEFNAKHDLKKNPTWALDPTHSLPRLMPMEAWFWMKYMTQGVAYVYEKICKPTGSGVLRRVKNGADYLTCVTIKDEEEVKQREIESKKRVIAFSADLPQWWEKAKTELMEVYGEIRSFDLETASNIELLDHMYDLMAVARKMWRIHWMGLITGTNAWTHLEELAMKYMGLTDLSQDFQKVMTGYDNKMLQVDKRLWLLSREAVQKGLADIILNSEPGEVLNSLSQSDSGRQWVEAFKTFLDEDGLRMTHAHVFHEKTWLEDPTPALIYVKKFIEKGEKEFSLEAERKKLAAEREAMTAQLMEKVPEEGKDEFTKLLAGAQLAGMFNEEHTYYCEHYCFSLIRRGMLGIGKRLEKAGTIDKAEDILMLNPVEVESVLVGPEGCDLRYLAERRLKEWEQWHQEEMLPLITTRNSPQEAFGMDIMSWRENMLTKIVVGIPPAPKPELKADLMGLPVSSGVAEGKAKVVMTSEDLDEVEKGDILVAPFTTTSWTTVFPLISGVVTDAGGALSHTAIVSREHNIPGVTNVGEATRKIKTGQRIKVDGKEGAVYILD